MCSQAPLQLRYRASHTNATTIRFHPRRLNYVPVHKYHNFCEATDNGKEIGVEFCDISKAFDRVWLRGLLHKLRAIDCSAKLTEWFASYLSTRRQRVVINGQTSEWEFIFAGASQGSVLGPLLFLIFINDIIKNIGASIRLFTDDTSLYIVVETPNTAVTILNGDLHQFVFSRDWRDFYLVKFNAAKTLSMVISRKVNKKSKRKVRGVPQSQTAALPRPQEEEETDKSKQAQTEQTYEKH